MTTVYTLTFACTSRTGKLKMGTKHYKVWDVHYSLRSLPIDIREDIARLKAHGCPWRLRPSGKDWAWRSPGNTWTTVIPGPRKGRNTCT